ncbi:MAG TPA: FISUMP domain-containing protein, partial [Bacteroidales bacterium]|nr:FISUMP domain-containing protein [Bacteroidales bacterium]
MKKIILISLLAFFGLSLNTTFAQNDSIYVMKNGSIIWKYKVAEIDSIVFYTPIIGDEEETSGVFVDPRDETEYTWVKIGEQIWMAENLAYAPPSGNYWAYENEESNVATYGYLYNWHTAMNGATSSETNPSGVQGICPAGWHLPSDSEWMQLEMHLGMTQEQANTLCMRGINNEGGKLKEAGTEHWNEPNEGATNETGFTALPGGFCYGFHSDMGIYGYWWSSTEYTSDNLAWHRQLEKDYSGIYRNGYNKEMGI